jgi:cytochrome c oxidase subunit 6a
MSLIARSTRTAVRTVSRTRPYSIVVDAPPSEWVAKREAIKHHASGIIIATLPLKVRIDLNFL